MSSPLSDRVLEVLNLVPVGEGSFRAESLEMMTGRIFGG
jgi:hypothetical protein